MKKEVKKVKEKKSIKKEQKVVPKKISVSFLSSPHIARDLEKLNLTDVDFIHVDFMDGKFVRQKSLPFKELKNIYRYTSKRLDVHLMVNKPKKFIKKFATLNTAYITFHVESLENIDELIDLVHGYGIKCGLALNPDTEIDSLDPYLDKLDLVLVMSVFPGKGGQEFILDTALKVVQLKDKIEKLKLDTIIEVDGGINLETKDYVSDASILVSGSYVIQSDQFQEAITSLR